MEHTANIMKTNNGLISLLLKVFNIFDLRLIGDEEKTGRNIYKVHQL